MYCMSCFSLSSSLYKAPWTRLMVYGLGHKVRRNGQLNLMEAVCYPLDASPSNTGLTPPPTANQYPSIIIPTDKVHVKLGMSNTLRCYIHFWISPTQRILLSMFNIYICIYIYKYFYFAKIIYNNEQSGHLNQHLGHLIYCLSNGKFGLVRLHSVIPMYFPAHTSQL